MFRAMPVSVFAAGFDYRNVKYMLWATVWPVDVEHRC